MEIVHDKGKFKVQSVEVEVNFNNDQKLNEIYAYLEESKYINITVYAKST